MTVPAAGSRIFIGGVGYTNLRDLSVGPLAVRALLQLDWPAGVEIDDLSLGGPIAAVHRFRAAAPYDRVVLVGAIARGGERVPGQIYGYRWDGALPDADAIQAHVAEAVTGVISLDGLLVVGGHFGIWPPEVLVIEVEPRDDDWGPEFSEPVRAAMAALPEAVRWACAVPIEQVSTRPEAAWGVGPCAAPQASGSGREA